jgi:RNA polymerase sigma-70 factor (ECF subfamily)
MADDDGVSDERLLMEWRAGEVHAGELLFNRHFETARRHLVNRVDNANDVEDLIQRAFLACVEARDRVECFRPYLLGTIRRLVYGYWTSRSRARSNVNIEDIPIADHTSSPSSMAARSVKERRVLEALRRLPLRQQTALELFYWERLTGRELASVLGMPESTARSLLRRAKGAFGREVRRMESLDRVPESTDDNLEAWARRIHERAASDEHAMSDGGNE